MNLRHLTEAENWKHKNLSRNSEIIFSHVIFIHICYLTSSKYCQKAICVTFLYSFLEYKVNYHRALISNKYLLNISVQNPKIRFTKYNICQITRLGISDKLQFIIDLITSLGLRISQFSLFFSRIKLI